MRQSNECEFTPKGKLNFNCVHPIFLLSHLLFSYVYDHYISFWYVKSIVIFMSVAIALTFLVRVYPCLCIRIWLRCVIACVFLRLCVGCSMCPLAFLCMSACMRLPVYLLFANAWSPVDLPFLCTASRWANLTANGPPISN